jgi:hypothetical protein
MANLDIFRSSAFSMVEMTASINRAPYTPGRIGAMGLFKKKPMRTTYVELQRKGNTIALLPSKPRGSRPTVLPADKRSARVFQIPHIPHDAEVLADAVQNVRAWESESELAGVSDVVNEKLDACRQNHEITMEFHRINAVKGVLIDGDGTTTLYDLYAEFGISRTAVDFLLGTPATNVKGKVEAVRRAIEDALGGLSYTGIHAFCGNDFWDKLVSHASVATAFERYQDGSFFRESQRVAGGFEFAGVFWENYRGKVGDVDFIPTADCEFVPLGVNDLFLEHYGPGDTMDTVNRPGQPIIAMQELKPMAKGVDIHTQSNPLMLATRPEVLIRGHTSN